jgi:hypothetical protein
MPARSCDATRILRVAACIASRSLRKIRS